MIGFLYYIVYSINYLHANDRYATSEGVVREEKGNFNSKNVWIVSGSVQTIDNAGKTHITYYVADDKGYRTKGI